MDWHFFDSLQCGPRQLERCDCVAILYMTKIQHPFTTGGFMYTLVRADEATKRLVNGLVSSATYVGTGGSDQREQTIYNTIEVADIYNIINPALTTVYDVNRERLRAKGCAGETELLHCPSNAALESILRNGFDPAFTQRAAYGAGVYFADDMGKADQYAEKHTAGRFKGFYTMLLCKVTLGCMQHWVPKCLENRASCFATTQERVLRPLPHDNAETYDSIVVDADELRAWTGYAVRFNEYMLPAKNGTNGALPVAIIVYRRQMVEPSLYELAGVFSDMCV